MNTIATDDTRVHEPLYTVVEAARLARVAPATARAWLMGYTYPGIDGVPVQRPPVTPRSNLDPQTGVSFIELVELAAIGELKRLRFSLANIRTIVDVCRTLLNVPHPLASEIFRTDGRDIFVRYEDGLLDVLRRKGALAWDTVLDPFLATLDYQHRLARRWWPLGKDRPVVIDPDYGFGFPVIEGTGVRTEIVYERFLTGELADEIAADFRLDPVQVERALQFESARHAA